MNHSNASIQLSRFLLKLTFLILTSYFLLPTSISAATSAEIANQINQVRRDREVLLEEQRRLQVELEKVTAEGQSLGTTVKSLDTTRRKLAADIKVTQSKIAATDLNIKSLESNVNTAERRIDLHQKAISSAIQSIYHHDHSPLLLALLASSSFSLVWRDRTQLEGLSVDLDEEVYSLRETKATLSQEKQRKEKVKEQILSLNRELSGQKAVIEESQKAKEKLLAETKNKEALYQQMLAENLRRQKEFEEDLNKLESELRITLDPSLIPTKRAGVLEWPLDKVFVTQQFGKTAGAARLYASGSHNGVDLRATQGTAVKAMLSGVVQGAGNTDEQRGCGSYGRWILVRHDNGLSSVYSHLSASLVNTGQAVGTGQVIGYSGGMPGVFGSGYSTGPHLHVGLFASQGVAIQQFVSSRGCKQVYIPIADPKAYLDPLAYLPAL